MMECIEVLESVDGMVGNYELACDLAQKRADQQARGRGGGGGGVVVGGGGGACWVG